MAAEETDNTQALLAQWATDLDQAHRRLAHGLMAHALANGTTTVDPRAVLGPDAADTVKLVQWLAETWRDGAPHDQQLSALKSMHQALQDFFASHEQPAGPSDL